MILPGATIGILGGGQLGRMIAMAAAQLGYRCHVLAPNAESVAAEVSHKYTRADWADGAKLAEFGRQCDVVTYEFENVPVAPLAAIPAGKLAPGTRALEVAQDRLEEKRFVEGLGGRPAPYASVDSRKDLDAAIARIGAPGILKTRREGYDGKGQWRIAEAGAELASLPVRNLVYEGFVRFAGEFSVILVRGRDGEVRFWESAENRHDHGILAQSFLPASPEIAVQVEAGRKLARDVADALDYVGVLTLEFFATEEGPVFNEMAPRVHNSGHWSIEGAVTSQFENHVRAICGLPLGDTGLSAPKVKMWNLIGSDVESAADILAQGDTHLHLYGKAEPRESRKMGHVTRLVWS